MCWVTCSGCSVNQQVLLVELNKKDDCSVVNKDNFSNGPLINTVSTAKEINREGCETKVLVCIGKVYKLSLKKRNYSIWFRQDVKRIRINYAHTERNGCTLGWVNFSEFEITVCGSCKMSTTKKLKWPFLISFKKIWFCENPLSFFNIVKKINYIFANVWKLF